MTATNTLPTNHAAERQILAAIAYDHECLDVVRELVSGDDLHHPRYRLIFEAMTRLASHGEPIRFAALIQCLRDAGQLEDAGGEILVADILGEGFTAATVARDARIVRELARLRRLIGVCNAIAHEASGPIGDSREFLDGAERRFLGITGERATDHRSDMASAIAEAQALTAEAEASDGGLVGVPSGIHSLDVLTQGFKRDNLVIVGGTPGTGKSSFIAGVVVHAAVQCGIPVAFFTLEMSRPEMAQRMRSLASGVSFEAISRGRLTSVQRDRLAEADAVLSAAPIHLDDRTNLSPFEVASAARRYSRDFGGLGLIVVDYLHLMRAEGRHTENREREVNVISKGLKALAKEIHVPVIALSQLRRDTSGKPRRPMLSDLRESGALEQDADLVLLLYREEMFAATDANRGMAEVQIAKHRNGKTGILDVRFDDERCRYSDP